MARPKVPKRIGNYGDDFKMKAVRLTFMEGTQVQEVAKALDIHPFMLSRWRKEYREGKIVADRRVKRVVDVEFQSKIKELKKLEAENAKLRVENDLLKKAIRFSSARRKKSSNS
jgi:transposase